MIRSFAAALAALSLLLSPLSLLLSPSPAYAANPYLASGTIVSKNLLAGTSAASITDFYYDLTSLPGNSSATIQFSKDDNTWYSSAGVLGGSDTLATLGGATLSLSALNWSGTGFYYRITLNATSDLTAAPALAGVRLDYAPAAGFGGMLAVDKSTGNVEVGGGGGSAGSALSVLGGAAIGPDYLASKSTDGLMVEGSVTIGTTSPSSQLTLDGSGNGKFFEGLNSTVAQGGLVFSHYSDSGGGTAVGFGNNLYYDGTGALTQQVASLAGWLIDLNNRSGYSGLRVKYMNTAGVASTYFALDSSGNASVGTSTPYARLTVWGPDAAAGTAAFLIANSASTTEFSVFDNGSATLAGTLTQNSDQRLKTNVQSLDASSSLAAIERLDPVTFNWIDPTEGSTTQTGFIAQQVQPIFPQLVSTTSATALTPDGTLGLNYIGFIAPIVSAIKELASVSGSFEQNLIAWLGNAGNGIGDLFAKNLYASNVTADTGTFGTLCVADSGGKVCVTRTQLAAILAATGQASAGGSSGGVSSPAGGGGSLGTVSSSVASTPPQIQINGANPATIQIGATYNDLGATVTGPQSDVNLGIHTYVNGVKVEPVQIDTSAAATDTIEYVVTDANGLTSTSTRRVIVEAPSAGEGSSSATSTTATSSPTIEMTSQSSTSTATTSAAQS